MALLFFAPAVLSAHSAISVVNTQAKVTSLEKPAQRIVSLSPHVTELIVAAGAAAALVAITQSCDYPKSITALPRVSSAAGVNLESLIALKPDLVVAWPAGNRAQDLVAIKKRGIAVYESAPQTLEDIVRDLENIGTLAGTKTSAVGAAREFRAKLGHLKKFQTKTPLHVFYQLGDGTLYTLNHAHPVMEILNQCGAQNVFANAAQSAPQVSVEAVIAANPDALLLAAPESAEAVRAFWQRQPIIGAQLAARLLVADGALLHRPTPRLLEAAAPLCAAIENLRARIRR